MKTLVLALVATTALAAASQAQADTTVIGFDDVPEGTIATAQYNGVVFTGASVLTENSALNSTFPPWSDPNVVYDYLDGTITLDFTTLVTSIGAYVTGNTAITLYAYNGATLLGSTATPGANYTGSGTGFSPNIFLNLMGSNITRAVFTNGQGIPNTFTLDDVTVGGTVTTNGVPEPATWAMMISGFGLVGGAMRRRARKVSVTYA